MFSSIGLRLWSIILSLTIVVVGLTAITGIRKMGERSTALLLDNREATIAATDLTRQIEKQIGAKASRQEPPVKLADIFSEMEQLMSTPESVESLFRLRRTWNEFKDAGNSATAEEVAALRKRLTEFNAATASHFEHRKTELFSSYRGWTVAGAVVTFLGLLTALVFYHAAAEIVISPLDRVAKFIDRFNAGDTSIRIPDESSGAVRRLGRACNRLFENYEKIVDEGRTQVGRRQRQCVALIEAFDRPLVMTDDSGALLLANARAREILTSADREKWESAISDYLNDDEDATSKANAIIKCWNKADANQYSVFELVHGKT